MSLAFISHLVAGLGFLGCGLLLLTVWRGSALGGRAAVGFAAGAVWSGLMAWDAAWGLSGWVLAGADAARYAAWFTACFVIAGTLALSLHRGLLVLAAVLFALALLVPALNGLGIAAVRPDKLVVRAGLLLSFAGIVLVEQLLRSAPQARSRATKLVAIGVGGQFAYDLFLYSQAELLGKIDAEAWAVRGFALTLFLIPTMLGLRRLAEDKPPLFVSRHMVLYTSAFITVGTYLCVMAAGGYYLKAHGGSWGESLRLLFFVGAGIVLTTVLLSDSLWRRVKVFIATHFYRNKYDYRLEWLRFIRTLSSPDAQDARRTAIRAVAQIFSSPAGLLYLRSDIGERFVAAAQWPEPAAGTLPMPALAAIEDMPRFLREKQWVIDLVEYQARPHLYRIRLPAWLLDARHPWGIVVPLLQLDRLIGFMALRPPPPPFHMTFEDRDLLKTVGRHVAVLLAQQETDQRLTESRQFDAYNRFTAFVMHDLKNAIAQLQLLVTNAVSHRHNPEFMDDAISTISNTVDRMRRLMEQLQGRDTQGRMREVALAPLIEAAVMRCAAHAPAPTIESVLPACMVTADPDKLGSIVDHVIRNAQDAAGSQGTVTVSLQEEAGCAVVAVADSGAGMESEFVRDRLFRPFDSTKGAKGMGIGAYQTREYVRLLGGDVEVHTAPHRGTQFVIRLPLCQRQVAGRALAGGTANG